MDAYTRRLHESFALGQKFDIKAETKKEDARTSERPHTLFTTASLHAATSLLDSLDGPREKLDDLSERVERDAGGLGALAVADSERDKPVLDPNGAAHHLGAGEILLPDKLLGQTVGDVALEQADDLGKLRRGDGLGAGTLATVGGEGDGGKAGLIVTSDGHGGLDDLDGILVGLGGEDGGGDGGGGLGHDVPRNMRQGSRLFDAT